ncbi:hypothetical protein GCM10011332_31510 [Terasakiella brassicae]|uniref:Glycosyl transferase family 1 domain-containing protein n=1 Tax=Terasakiella brassicae TaxID=1634917 RepID=A0A917FFU8_9PROT|nr:glycosyltransferase family 1 protein [Terasakiella brassicae]GGF75194.1 hypothetical protein GCM10011332_31510 [Terasakiella brassicae]
MTIFINISNTVNSLNTTGIQRVVRQFIIRWQRYDHIVFLGWDGEYFHTIDRADDIDNVINARSITYRSPFILDQYNEGDVFYDIDASWGDSYDIKDLYKKLKKRGVIIVKMHFDAVPILTPQFSHKDTVFKYCENFSAAIDYADYWTCISQTVEDDLHKICQKLNVSQVFSSVIPLGADFNRISAPCVNPSFLPEILNNKNYFLCVGTVEPRKNHAFLLDVFEKIWQKGEDIHLVIVGKRGWNIDDLVNRIQKHPEYKKRLHWFNKLKDEEVANLYGNAYASVNLSHYEGYGLPVVESLNYDCVTICTQDTALEEVASGAAYATPLDEDKAVSVIMDVLKPDVYKEYKERSINFEPKPWDDASQELYAFLHNIDTCSGIEFHPKQAVYISVRPQTIARSLTSINKNMSFIKEAVILTSDKKYEELKAALKEIELDITLLKESDLGISSLPTDAQKRNTHLRQKLYSLDQIDPNFIAFDDDYTVLKECKISDFLNNGVHNAHYFDDNGKNWLGAYPKPTSFDKGIWRTTKFLLSGGYDYKLYNSHMPQIINKFAITQVFERTHPLGLDEWSSYFNIVKHLYPKNFKDVPYRCSGWPESHKDWVPSVRPADIIFSNSFIESEEFTEELVNEYLESYDSSLAMKNKIEPQNPEFVIGKDTISFNGDVLNIPQNIRVYIKLTTELLEYKLYIFLGDHAMNFDHTNTPRFIFIPEDFFLNKENTDFRVICECSETSQVTEKKIPVVYID